MPLVIYSFLLLDLVYFHKYRGIDYAVANKEKPTTAHDLPKLMKQVMTHMMQKFNFVLSVLLPYTECG